MGMAGNGDRAEACFHDRVFILLLGHLLLLDHVPKMSQSGTEVEVGVLPDQPASLVQRRHPEQIAIAAAHIDREDIFGSELARSLFRDGQRGKRIARGNLP